MECAWIRSPWAVVRSLHRPWSGLVEMIPFLIELQICTHADCLESVNRFVLAVWLLFICLKHVLQRAEFTLHIFKLGGAVYSPRTLGARHGADKRAAGSLCNSRNRLLTFLSANFKQVQL